MSCAFTYPLTEVTDPNPIADCDPDLLLSLLPALQSDAASPLPPVSNLESASVHHLQQHQSVSCAWPAPMLRQNSLDPATAAVLSGSELSFMSAAPSSSATPTLNTFPTLPIPTDESAATSLHDALLSPAVTHHSLSPSPTQKPDQPKARAIGPSGAASPTVGVVGSSSDASNPESIFLSQVEAALWTSADPPTPTAAPSSNGVGMAAPSILAELLMEEQAMCRVSPASVDLPPGDADTALSDLKSMHTPSGPSTPSTVADLSSKPGVGPSIVQASTPAKGKSGGAPRRRPVHSVSGAGVAVPTCSARRPASAGWSSTPALSAVSAATVTATGLASDAPVRKQRRRYAKPRSSKYCHLCARHERVVRMLPCGNLARGLCQKSVCRKCFVTYGLGWERAAAYAMIMAQEDEHEGLGVEQQAVKGANEADDAGAKEARRGLIADEGNSDISGTASCSSRSSNEQRLIVASGMSGSDTHGNDDGRAKGNKLAGKDGSLWLCPHCTNSCPKRAKCFAYDRQTVRRRVKTREARMMYGTSSVPQ